MYVFTRYFLTLRFVIQTPLTIVGLSRCIPRNVHLQYDYCGMVDVELASFDNRLS